MKVKLTQIIADREHVHCRVKMLKSVIADYSEAMLIGAQFPPLDVFYDGKDYWLADGFYRYEAAKRNNEKEFECNVHQGTQKDALWFAIGANKENGKGMTRREIASDNLGRTLRQLRRSYATN